MLCHKDDDHKRLVILLGDSISILNVIEEAGALNLAIGDLVDATLAIVLDDVILNGLSLMEIIVVIRKNGRIDHLHVLIQMVVVGRVTQHLGRCVIGEEVDIRLMRGIELLNQSCHRPKAGEGTTVRLVGKVIFEECGIL